MKYERLLELVGGLPVVDSSSLLAFGEDPKALSVQLDRWTKAGKLLRLRRGFYALPEYLQRQHYSLELIANLLVTPSYVSLERALQIRGLIPEMIPLIQSVTMGRPVSYRTPLGTFQYRHVKQEWFFGYEELQMGAGSALVATPEKALLDWFYLTRGEHTLERIAELRLQETEQLDLGKLREIAARGGPRLVRAARRVATLIQRGREGEVEL